MKFTGERYVSHLNGQIKYEHLHRYALCLEFVTGKSVLDIASGEGYGSALLAKVAESVVGVDISSEAIEYATQEYSSLPNLQFLAGSCDSIPLPDNSVDVVTSFETIEHHDKHEEMMLEIKRVLKPDGVLIISSPNRLIYSDEPKQQNPFHVKELYYNELVDLLNSYFKFCQIYGQRLATNSFIFTLQDSNYNSVQAYSGQLSNLNRRVPVLESPLYFVAICSDNKEYIQNNIDSIYIDENDDLLKDLESQIKQAQVELERAQLQLKQTQVELERSQFQLQQTQAELSEANSSIIAMHTSKFWKMRILWFKVKGTILNLFLRLRKKITFKFKKYSLSRLVNKFNAGSFVVEEVLPPKPLVKYSVSVDIIICVHNALDDVKQCLESVASYSSIEFSLILVDDGSNEETSMYLQSFANSHSAKLIRNEVARGYTLAANQGLIESQADYVILLNSDTIVTPNWINRIIACGESDQQIGMIGPLSNTASWQSIPEIFHQGDWAENHLSEGVTVTDMGKMVAEYSPRLYPKMPFLNGFCLAIKRRLIEDIGYFDEANFGGGYGEENDYCLRARKAGWKLAIADNTYVYHSQSRSYSNERRKLLCEQASKNLAAKHGEKIINEGVVICRYDRVIEGIRSRAQVMLMRQQLIERGKSQWGGKRVLFILPISEPGGGGNVVFQEALAMQKMGVDVSILNFNANREVFEKSYPDHNIPVIYVNKEEEISTLLAEYDAVIATLYKSVDWLEISNINTSNLIRGYYIQDFEPYFFPKDSKDFKIAWDSYTRYPELIRITKTEWNRNKVKTLVGVDCNVVGPSVNIDLFRPRPRRDPNCPQRPLRIAAMVRPSSPRRSPKLTMEILKEVHRAYGNNIEIIIFGCESKDDNFLVLPHDFAWQNLGILTRPQLAFLLNEIDIFVDFSTFQAMGLTAMEAMACGVAVILPQNGGINSFAIHNQNCMIVDTSSVEACITALKCLIMDEQLRTQIQRQAIFDICQYFPEKVAFNILNALFPINYYEELMNDA
ncbi:MAG: methyltransferase domain-containing protein [Calothrix sp. MO_192.B10]|nr:methyltransferase domain-containing protein [Calothrix sp. MO_192.B10]